MQAGVIRTAAELGGTIDRDTVYDVCGYDDSRMLRGFTRPAAQITADLQRECIVGDHVTPMLVPLYPDDVRAGGVPHHGRSGRDPAQSGPPVHRRRSPLH